MEIESTRYKRCDVIKPIGRVDTYTAPKLEERLQNLTDEGRFKIVLDMSEVDFVSSKGLWVMTETQKNCKRYNRGELVLVNPKEKIKDSLDLVGMSSYFKIYDDLTAAVGSF